MHTLPRRLRLSPTRVMRVALMAVIAASSLVIPARASAQTAADLYARAQTRAAAATATPTVAGLRAAAAAYEAIVRKYPRSGFCDDALWHGALAARLAWEQFHQPADRATATRLLTWLRREYPRSSLIAQVPAQLTALTAAARPASSKPAAAAPAGSAPATTSAMVPPAGVATIRNITRTDLPRGERLTIELDREVPVTPERIANPERVFFDLRNTQFDQTVAAALDGVNGPRIANVRIGRQDAHTTRVVLSLAGAPRHSVFALYHPYRLVVDLEADALPPVTGSTEVVGPESAPPPIVTHPAIDPRPIEPLPTTPATAVAPIPVKSVAPLGLPPAPPAETSTGDYSLARQLGLGVSRIVIDAGHGGHDPGAQANGIVEADLVLDIAQRVEKLLKKQPGIDVILTRRTDVFIPLEERTAIANREGADLFLSIHANASRRAAAQGVETYFLNFATNADAEAVAARENAGSQTSMGKLPVLVQQIALHNKMRESRELAQLVQANMVRSLRTQNKGVVDLGVKQAPFVVLIGAQMPSVLAELSFVTNKAEAALLKKDAYRQRIAQALADAVLKYQTSLKKVITTAVAGGG